MNTRKTSTIMAQTFNGTFQLIGFAFRKLVFGHQLLVPPHCASGSDLGCSDTMQILRGFVIKLCTTLILTTSRCAYEYLVAQQQTGDMFDVNSRITM